MPSYLVIIKQAHRASTVGKVPADVPEKVVEEGPISGTQQDFPACTRETQKQLLIAGFNLAQALATAAICGENQQMEDLPFVSFSFSLSP